MSSLSFLEGAVWGGAFCAALSAVVTSNYFQGKYEDFGYPSPIQKTYYRDTNYVATAKLFLSNELGYYKFTALKNHECYDQVLDVMLQRGKWREAYCEQHFGKIVFDFKGGFDETLSRR